jgi:hypothetical protein
MSGSKRFATLFGGYRWGGLGVSSLGNGAGEAQRGSSSLLNFAARDALREFDDLKT